MATVLLFIDGIGLGAPDPERNPFAACRARRLAPCAGATAEPDAAFRALDATLGVPGLPQSATGQTTLFTGVNAARLLGRHQVGLPGPTLWPVLEAESLFLKLVRRGAKPAFANAYPARYFEQRRPRYGATTRMVMAAKVGLRTLEEHEAENTALPHDYSGAWLAARGLSARARSAEDAARVLATLADGHDLVLYEYFLTDLAAHRGTPEQRREQAARVEALVDAVVRVADPRRHRVVVVSDHGNLEEADHDRHTLNPVPLLSWGRGAGDLIDAVRRFEDLTPVLSGDSDLDSSHRGEFR